MTIPFRNTARTILLSLSVCSILGLAQAIEVTGRFELLPTPLASLGGQLFTTNDLARAVANGLEHVDSPSLGSGLARVGDDEFVGISDRGPNGEVGGRRTFPLPTFAPHITRFKVRAGKIEILKSIVLADSKGMPISGLSNQYPEERLYKTADADTPLPYDPNGVDPEAIRVFPDGKFLISEEYGPSVLVVNTNGQVLMRYVPENKPLPGATYPVRAILPAVLSQRRTNRGFESLALSTDGKTAYVMLQSPLGDESDPKFQNARVSRALRLDLSDPLNARVTGHFLMPLSKASDYSARLKQYGVKLNDAEWLATDKLLVLEHASGKARLIVADFSVATNLQNNPVAATTVFEAAGDDFPKLSTVAATVEVFATIEQLCAPATKLEGLAILSPTEIALSNDNDFGVGNKDSEANSILWILRLARPLPMAQ